MIRTFCDICGKELDEFGSDAVNLDFNCYGVAGFHVVLNGKEYRKNELQLCVGCAEKVVNNIQDLQKIAEMGKRYKTKESRAKHNGKDADRQGESERPEDREGVPD